MLKILIGLVAEILFFSGVVFYQPPTRHAQDLTIAPLWIYGTCVAFRLKR
jgi:hypothetical protein